MAINVLNEISEFFTTEESFKYASQCSGKFKKFVLRDKIFMIRLSSEIYTHIHLTQILCCILLRLNEILMSWIFDSEVFYLLKCLLVVTPVSGVKQKLAARNFKSVYI